MFVVDTNILLYAVDADSPAHEPCRALLERCRRQAAPWFLSWNICYEFLRVATHHRVFHRPLSASQANRYLEALQAAPSLQMLTPTPRHAQLLAQCLEEAPQTSGNRMHDLHTAVLMREHGVHRICTRDSDFRRFPWLEVIDLPTEVGHGGGQVP